jgi:hypothetical protein
LNSHRFAAILEKKKENCADGYTVGTAGDVDGAGVTAGWLCRR